MGKMLVVLLMDKTLKVLVHWIIRSYTNLGDLCKSFGCFKEKINRLAELFLYILLLIVDIMIRASSENNIHSTQMVKGDGMVVGTY